MKIKELKEKPIKDLLSLIKENEEFLRSLYFSLEDKQLKDSSKILKTKKTIARIKTLLRLKK